MRRRSWLAVGAALALSVAACGGDDDDGTTAATGEVAPDTEATGPTIGEQAAATSLDTVATASSPPTSGEPATTTAGETSFPRTVEHEGGTTEIAAAPERVVSASVSLTGNLLAIDAPVVASGATQPNSQVGDDQGFFVQWGDVAAERGVAPLAGPTVDVEAVASQRPDLIIGTSNGADTITDIYDQLSAIAPTIMIDPWGSSWDVVATELAAATGREEQAADAIETFDALVADAQTSIGTPEFPAAAMVYNPDGINMFTPVSPHGRLLQDLGFEVADPGSSSTVEGGIRSDIASVSLELLPDVVGDATVFLVFADDTTLGEFLAVPVAGALPATTQTRVHPLGFDSFRLDYYSASNVVERIAESARTD